MLPRRSAFLLARQATTPPVVPVVVASQRGLTASAVHRKWFFCKWSLNDGITLWEAEQRANS